MELVALAIVAVLVARILHHLAEPGSSRRRAGSIWTETGWQTRSSRFDSSADRFTDRVTNHFDDDSSSDCDDGFDFGCDFDD